jgi:hypothetical protein
MNRLHRDTNTKTTNQMQLYRLIYYSKSALRVSGKVFAHHQEHFSVCTVSGGSNSSISSSSSTSSSSSSSIVATW